MKRTSLVTIILCLLALVLAFLAFNKANQAYQLALNDIELEERNTLMTPVYDEESGSWSYLAIFETAITNQGPGSVELETISKIETGAGFLVPLMGNDIVEKSLSYQAFPVSQSLNEVRSNPKLIKTLAASSMESAASLDIMINSGQTKSVRFGVMMDVYDANKQPTAQMVLLSMQFNFNNGKLRVFRRGIPITPLP